MIIGRSKQIIEFCTKSSTSVIVICSVEVSIKENMTQVSVENLEKSSGWFALQKYFVKQSKIQSGSVPP